MSDLKRFHLLRWGAHSNNTDFTSTPGTLTFVRPTNDPLIRVGYDYIDRTGYQTPNGMNLPDLRGKQSVGLPDVQIELEGLSGGGAGDGTASSSLSHTVAQLLANLCGSSLGTATGDTLNASDAGTGTSVIADGAWPTVPVQGRAWLIEGTTSGKLVARTTDSAVSTTNVSNDTITIERALTTDTGAADTAAEGTVAYGGRTINLDPDDYNVTHFFLQSELDNSERKFFGCVANWQLLFPRGDVAKVNLTGIQCTSWEDVAESGATYSAPTTGNPIITLDANLWIGSTLYQGFDFAFDAGLAFEPRASDGGPNGHWGFVRTGAKPVLTGKLRHGALTGPAEATDALLSTWRGANDYSADTFDVSLQVGRVAGAAVYIRIPKARLKLEEADEGGQIIYNMTAMASEDTTSRSGGGQAVSPFQVFFF